MFICLNCFVRTIKCVLAIILLCNKTNVAWKVVFNYKAVKRFNKLNYLHWLTTSTSLILLNT